MSFQPVFEITRILTDSTAVYIKDVTETGGTTGYGTTNAPASISAITSLLLTMQGYKDTLLYGVIDSGSDVSDLGTEIKYNLAVPDGVVLTRLLYGELKTNDVTVSNDRLSMSATGIGALLTGVSYISQDGQVLTPIQTINSNSIVFSSPFPGTDTALTQYYKYYAAEVRSHILYRADKCIAKEIEKVSLYNSDADTKKASLKVLLKEVAQREYSLANYSKANEATRLICGNQPVYNSTCSTCG